MFAAVPGSAVPLTLARGTLGVELLSEPLRLNIWRGDRCVVRDLGMWAEAGTGHDRLITLTEGVLPEEEREDPEPLDELTANTPGRRSCGSRRAHRAEGRARSRSRFRSAIGS